MPASFPRRLRTARSLRSYLEIFESSEGLRLGISTRQTFGHRQRNLIAVLDDVISTLYQQAPHHGQALLSLRDPEEFAFAGAQFDAVEVMH